jgi:hypothetical protein
MRNDLPQGNDINLEGNDNIVTQNTVNSQITVNQYGKTESPDLQNIDPDIQKFFNSLKERYKRRYKSKLDERFEIKLEVSKNWNGNIYKTCKFDAEAKTSDAIIEIRKVFGEEGRLLIVGSPGSGKTVLLLKLALELLGKKCKADQQLPVIFNLAAWSETYETFKDWLIDVLSSGNGLSKDFAETALREDKIIFLLDGLDELARNEKIKTAHEKRARCLDSLNDYLREGRKAVICCRREQFAEMQKATGKDAPVSAKVEVLDLTPPDILLALQNARQHNKSRVSAGHLEEIIEKNEVFLAVLTTPFYFTTALEVFDWHFLKEETFPADVELLKKQLLDKFIKNKLKHPFGLKKFDEIKTIRWLSWLARLMEKKQLVAFEFIDLSQTDLKREWLFRIIRSFVFGFITGYVMGVIIYFAAMMSDLPPEAKGAFELTILVLLAIVLCLILGIVSGLMLGGWFLLFALFHIVLKLLIGAAFQNIVSEKQGQKVRVYTYQALFKKIIYSGFIVSLVGGAISSLLGGFAYGLNEGLLGIFKGILFGLIFGSIFGLFIGLLAGTAFCVLLSLEKTEIGKKFVPLKKPYQRLIKDSAFGFAVFWSLSTALIISLSIRHYKPENWPDIFGFVVTAVLVGLAIDFYQNPFLNHIVLRVCFLFEKAMPLKYATFLDYAAATRILEKDGGHWRFRHQNLQEYFANLKDD